MQISYHSTLTKIQKLQNFEKNKKNQPVLPEIDRYGWYMAGTAGIFFGTKQGVMRTGLLAGTVYSDCTNRYGTELTPLVLSVFKTNQLSS